MAAPLWSRGSAFSDSSIAAYNRNSLASLVKVISYLHTYGQILCTMSITPTYPDFEDWTRIEDKDLRKKLQNRLSQRRHRES
jgi:hypothetical protein